MSEPTASAVGDLEFALACAAVSDGLRTILLLDADGLALSFAADVLARCIRDLSGRTAVTVAVPSAADEDELWSRSLPAASAAGFMVEERPGAFGTRSNETQVPVLLIPDLARLELPAARGLLAALDPVVIHLERQAISRTWGSETFCLAACDRKHAATVSPHLLDRFALRLDGAEVAGALGGPRALEQWLEGRDPEPIARANYWKPPGSRRPAILDPALDRVLTYLPDGNTHRRSLALARLASAIATLEQAREVREAHVDRAAAMIGLRTASDGQPKIPSPAIDPDAPAGDTFQPTSSLDVGAAAGSEARAETSADSPTDAVGNAQDEGPPPDATQLVEAAQAAAVTSSSFTPASAASPYPEDASNRVGALWPLKDIRPSSRARTVPRGSIIGVRRAREARDLALISTLLEAAKWQGYRQQESGSSESHGRLILWPSDLRSYRRAAQPETLLALVLDFTCIDGWRQLLVPHLRWAYAKRASVCLVRVGASDAQQYTRADRLIARTLLDPRVDRALQAGPGSATPLAHGLALVAQTLRHGMHHGQGIVRHARLVVATDGRGNVPLYLRPDGAVDAAGAQAALTDALDEAKKIVGLSAVTSVVLDPGPVLYRHLITDLAEALGAAVMSEQGWGEPEDESEEPEAA